MKRYSKILFAAALSLGGIFFASCEASKNDNVSRTREKTQAVAADPNEPVKITVSTVYEPKSVAVKKGQTVKLAFFRTDEKNCGDEVVFPSFGIKKSLPVGETVTVELTPQESGELVFTCGMDMMRGKIIVQ